MQTGFAWLQVADFLRILKRIAKMCNSFRDTSGLSFTELNVYLFLASLLH